MTTWNSWFEKNLACNTQTYEVGIRTQHKPTSVDTGLKLQQIPGRCMFFWSVFLLTWMLLLFFKWHVGTQYTMFMNSTVGGRNPAITSWGNGRWNPLIYRDFKNIPGGDRRFLPATVEFMQNDFDVDMNVSENNGFSPQIIHFNRVFHYFHHPFWDTPIFGNTHILLGFISEQKLYWNLGFSTQTHKNKMDCLYGISQKPVSHESNIYI